MHEEQKEDTLKDNVSKPYINIRSLEIILLNPFCSVTLKRKKDALIIEQVWFLSMGEDWMRSSYC